jgi:hypothetical protein
METHEHEHEHEYEYSIGLYLHGGIGYYNKRPGSGTDERGYFAFIRALYNHRFYEEDPNLSPEAEIALSTRCDSSAPKSMPVPSALHEEDEDTGLCKMCGSDKPVYGTTNSHHASLTNTKILRMPFHGYKGFIAYLELHDSEIEETEVYTNPNVTRTLQELFKLMLEWDWVYENLDKEDICAVLAHNMLEEFELPENIKQWIWDEVPDMHVARFLKGDTDARSRPHVSQIPEMTPEFEGWCWHQINKPPLWQYGSR